MAVLNGMSEDDSPMCSGASPLLAVIGESGSAQSIVVSRILQPFRIPMVIMPLLVLNPPNLQVIIMICYTLLSFFFALHRSVTFLHVHVSLTEQNTLPFSG